MKIILNHNFEDIISIDNLLFAWREFIRGKRNKSDVQLFQFQLMNNIISLRNDLQNKTYKHGGYEQFKISDPKPRIISKAQVRDRLLHHAIYRILYPFFDKTFSHTSYSCRLNKGTHKAINQLRNYFYIVSQNNTKTCWALKCDIRRFFDNIDHQILISTLKQYIPDKGIIWLFEEIINSFHSTKDDVGLPLGNLTSQLFVNVYMNSFDQYIKHILRVKCYIRYADDFVVLSENRDYLINLISQTSHFLEHNLKLHLHSGKVSIKALSSGIDFLGWVSFPDHRILRTSTKRKMIKKLRTTNSSQVVNSYLGLIKHGNTYNLRRNVFQK
ncbi:MAG: group II intron reverse transcriptase domain-containing protein [Candidatus Pacebacteria bacterium]|nr:group II intron reverse transcriptase domain-containing protein [Candidatus Paceibacterota bacterium]